MEKTLDYVLTTWKITPGKTMPIEIPDMSREELGMLFRDLGFKKGAEIGVLAGAYSKKLVTVNPGLKLFGIDPWLSYPEFTTAGPQSDYETLYAKAKKTVLPGTVLVRKKSMDALADFEDNSLDFVYIDGNHEFTSEANDIHEWQKKVRPDGIVSGHDYAHYHLSSYSHTWEVVNAYTSAYRIRPWFVIGGNKNNIRSWFWIKK